MDWFGIAAVLPPTTLGRLPAIPVGTSSVSWMLGKKIEKHQLERNSNRGGTGSLDIEVAQADNGVSSSFMKALESEGLTFIEVMNSTGPDRAAIVSSNTRRGIRRSAAKLYSRPARRR